MPIRRGLTLGKFHRLHRGHELMLQTAAACVDHLFVLIGVSDDDPYSFDLRAKWVNKAVADVLCYVTIIAQPELDTSAPKDADGTVLDEQYWVDWLASTRKLVPDADGLTHVFTSDFYGERVAREFGAVWYPVDPDRSIIPVSGTRVRTYPLLNWHNLSDEVRKDITKVFALVGPESTGKSTLTKRLGYHFDTPFVPEWGRTVCKRSNNDLTKEDFRALIQGQCQFMQNAKSRALKPFVFSDTENLVTALYYEMYYPEDKDDELSQEILHSWKDQPVDHYIVCAPTVPWVQDGDRFMSEMDRWQFHTRLLELLREYKKDFIVLDHSDFQYRQVQAIKYVLSLSPGYSQDTRAVFADNRSEKAA